MNLRKKLKSCLRACGYELRRWPECRTDVFGHLAQIVQRYDIDCVIDVGANRGQFATGLREVGYRGEIISFEPVSSCFEKLSETAAGDEHWQVHQLALGEKDETAEIQVYTGRELSSFLAPNEFFFELFGRKSEPVGVEKVEVRRLDGIIESLIPRFEQKKIFLKLDTQGYDLRVLEGVGSCITEFVGIMSELTISGIYKDSIPFSEAIAQLQKDSFEISGLFPVQHDRHLRLLEFDCLLLNPKFYKDEK